MTTSLHKNIRGAIRVALESSLDPAMAAADWLARDIDGRYGSAVELVADPGVSLENLQRAKSVYKTMRILGETAADRRLGAHLYVAAIAAALVVHRTRISSQSTAALRRGLQSLEQDDRAPHRLRALAVTGLLALARAPRGSDPPAAATGSEAPGTAVRPG
jgi:hypothetical protein